MPRLSELEYEWFLSRQGNVCAICGAGPDRDRRLAIDHCHDTGAIRGLLCGKCNRGLGHLGDGADDARLLRQAIVYVSKNHEQPVGLHRSRGDAMRLRTHCPDGHEFTPENTRFVGGWRQCAECHRQDERKRYRDKVQREPGLGASATNAAKTHCIRGHEFTVLDSGRRICTICKAEAKRIRYAAWRAENPSARGKGAHEREKTHCPHGHEYSAENTYRRPDGSRVCKTCRREQEQARRMEGVTHGT